MHELTRIGRECGTDKASQHGYTQFYGPLLEHLRDRPVRLLEIGVGGDDDLNRGGESLRMWKQFFRYGTIIGLDYFDKSKHAEDRVLIRQGDQSDPAVLASLVHELGPFDVIIDDGSHINSHMVGSFKELFPTLSDGGIYIIEDLQTSYWPEYGGSIFARAPGTIMRFLHDRVDGLNFAEFRRARYEANNFDREIVEMRFRNNTVALIKGDNIQTSNMNHPHPLGVRKWVTRDLFPQVWYYPERARAFLESRLRR